MRCGSFIGGSNISNSSIRGHGTIDGQGAAWWDAESGAFLHGRGRLIEPMYCYNFTMTGVTVANPPFWGIHPFACDTLLFEDVVFMAPLSSPNTDGIDPDSCSNVVIRNLTATCGDDAIGRHCCSLGIATCVHMCNRIVMPWPQQSSRAGTSTAATSTCHHGTF